MKLVLHRTTFTDKSTIGELDVDGVLECFTLEDVVRPDGVKIHGETAIPAGIYDVQLTMSPRFKRVLPLLLDVKNFIGVRIHPGNAASDTEGCILVGRSHRTDWIGQSQVAFNTLFAKLEAAHARREPITLTIA